MQKDLKIGMILGLVLIVASALWISTRPQLSTKARLLETSSVDAISDIAKQSDADIAIAKESEETDANEPQNTGKLESKTNSLRFHIVSKGETLSGISQKYYGSINKVQKILNANRETLNNPDKLKPGLKIVIPD